MKQELSNKEFTRFHNRLTKAGMKATAQRIAVYEAMLSLGHASADMVQEWIQENSQTKITTASVYNILSQLADIGIYSHRMSANNKMYFDVTTQPHLHLYNCEDHSFKDVNDEKLHERIMELLSGKRFRGYRIEDVDIQFVVRPTRRRP